jgi:hypothetical protein
VPRVSSGFAGWQRRAGCGVIVFMAKTVKGRVGWAVVKKLLKAIPIIGPVFTIGFAGHDIKKKGIVPGAVHVGLDVTPVVGTAKNLVEIVTGDWIPDKAPKTETQSGGQPPSSPRAA